MVHDPAKLVHESHAEWQARLQHRAQEAAAQADMARVARDDDRSPEREWGRAMGERAAALSGLDPRAPTQDGPHSAMLGSLTAHLNAPVPMSEQVARSTAGHAEYQRAVGGILGLGSIEAEEIRRMGAGGVADAVKLQQHHDAQMRLVQQRRAPGKMFSRSDILAILKAQKCLNDSHMIPAMREGGDDVLRSLIRIFENLE